MRSTYALITLTAFALSGISPAAAQVAAPPAVTKPKPGPDDTPANLAKKREASQRLLTLLKPVWADEEIGRIMYIGWYSGAAALCDDLEIDQVKLAAALNALMPKDQATMPPARVKFVHDNLLLHVGMATGWAMAGHYRDVPKFCAEGRAAKAELPADKHLFDTETEPNR